MRRYRIWAATALMLFLLVRLVPGFGGFWGERISLPLLRGLAKIGSSAPFSLLEWGALAAAGILLLSLLFRRFGKSLLCMLLALASAYLAIWYPLYFFAQPEYSASSQQVAAVCGELIGELNTVDADFAALPPLPAKFARFPGWMRELGITGICSFLTGEALVSPELPNASLPFVAVHERMHLEGVAGEGAANIAAWENCMARGGAFAASAKIWAVRYCMGMLRQADHALYERCMDQMNPRTLELYREAGGAYAASGQSGMEKLLGVRQDYEILAHYLAAEPGQ
ncbi:MAG: DUF3810 family protein [Clostridia bacterium]|nr:DUF3810 family protein [Clostridia bacterium]